MSEKRWRDGQRAIHIELNTSQTAKEIHIAIEKLNKLLGGADGYYTWASTLPVVVLLNNNSYLAAIKEKIKELEAHVTVK